MKASFVRLVTDIQNKFGGLIVRVPKFPELPPIAHESEAPRYANMDEQEWEYKERVCEFDGDLISSISNDLYENRLKTLENKAEVVKKYVVYGAYFKKDQQ